MRPRGRWGRSPVTPTVPRGPWPDPLRAYPTFGTTVTFDDLVKSSV
ncbi:hypothetical protein GA0115239_10087 [Streptomyces sp. BpilaLS-43]|nr:hypothetical protein GA0115239_10087 [Streptomyces sp. BpilaLS-43]